MSKKKKHKKKHKASYPVAQPHSLEEAMTEAPPAEAAPEVPSIAADDKAPADTVHAQKLVAFYAAVANGWITTKMELDKTLLTLSTAGLGLFLTLLTTVGVRSRIEFGFYLVGTVAFAIAIVCGLAIFDRNADFLEALTSAREVDGDPKLARLDKWLRVSFFVGAVAAILAGASAAYSKYIESQNRVTSEGRVPEDKKPKTTPSDSLTESLNGIQKLRQTGKGGDSLSVNGFQKLRPAATSSVTPAQKGTPSAPTNTPTKKSR